MNIFSKIGSFLFGQGASAVKDMANIADEYVYTKEEQAEDVRQDLEMARTYQPADMPIYQPIKQTGLIPYLLDWLLAAIGRVVDAVNHAIRPCITIIVMGLLFGFWQLPNPDNIHPLYWRLADTVIKFWFAGRILSRDVLPYIAKYIDRRKL